MRRAAPRTFWPGWFYYVAVAWMGLCAWLFLRAPSEFRALVGGVTAAGAAVYLVINWERLRLDEVGIHVRTTFTQLTLPWDTVGEITGSKSEVHDMDVRQRVVFRINIRDTNRHIVHRVSPWISRRKELSRLGREYLRRHREQVF